MVTPSRIPPGLIIRLGYNDQTLYEIRAHEIASEIEIGRSSSCVWRVPSEDALISSHHAAIKRDGQVIILRDKGSKNGTWFQGKRIEERKLKEGDRITLGHCVLTVERENIEAAFKAVAELEILTGHQRREHKLIQTARLTIGASPDSDLLLTDDLVSRNHAVILRKGEDGYWLKALNTTNGTKVNDVPLRADQERLLKEGDRIAIAHVEMVFRDGSNRQKRGQGLRRLAVMAATGIVVAAVYFGWQFVRASARVAVDKAQAHKEAGQFAVARNLLDGAIDRRGYSDVQVNADQLRAQIGKCESVLQSWQAVQSALQKSDWIDADAQLGKMAAFYNDNDAWIWRQGAALQGVDLRDQSRQIKNWLGVFLKAGHLDSILLPELAECERRLKDAVDGLKSCKEYQAFYAAVVERREALSQFSKELATLNRLLQQLSDPDSLPNPNQLLKEIDSLSANGSSGSVRKIALEMQPLLRRLTEAYNQFVVAMKLATDAKFDEANDKAKSARLKLPSPEECIFKPQLLEFRKRLENSWLNFTNELPEVASLIGALSSRLDSPTNSNPAELIYWQDNAKLAKIFQCDSLSLQFPKYTRPEPQGEYDRALCVEWFYASLKRIVDQSMDEIPDPPFESGLGAALKTVAAAQALTKYLTPADKKHWQNGKIQLWLNAARRVIELRDRIANEMLERSRKTSGRESLIAGGIAWQFMDTHDKSFREEIKARMKEVHANVMALNNQRDVASLSGRIALRNKILSSGLPGHPVVNQMWLEASNSGSKP